MLLNVKKHGNSLSVVIPKEISDRQATLYELAAAYGYGLIKNH